MTFDWEDFIGRILSSHSTVKVALDACGTLERAATNRGSLQTLRCDHGRRIFFACYFQQYDLLYAPKVFFEREIGVKATYPDPMCILSHSMFPDGGGPGNLCSMATFFGDYFT